MSAALSVMLLLVLSLPPRGLEQIQHSKKEADKRQAREIFAEVTVDPSLSSPASGPAVQLLLETSTLDAKRAKAQIGIQIKDTIVNIKLEGPLESKTDQTTWADLNGLANSVVLDIGLSWFYWKVRPNRGLEEAICRYRCDFLRNHKLEDWEELLKKKKGLNSDNIPEEYKKYLKGAYGTPLQFGVRGQIGKNEYTYLDSAKYEKKDSNLPNYAGILFGGLLFPDFNLYLGLSYRYQSSYKAGDPQKICIPFGDIPGALRCFELPVGEPEQNRNNIGQLEARYFYSAQLAFNPKVTYDFDAKVLGAEFPVYFLRNTKEGLNGGVSVGWRSDKKDWGLRFFVGNAFRIFRD